MQNKIRVFTKLRRSIGNMFYEERLSNAIRSATNDEVVLKKATRFFHANLAKGYTYEESIRLAITTVFSKDPSLLKVVIDNAKLGKPFKTKTSLALTCILLPPAAVFFWVIIKPRIFPDSPKDRK